MKVFTMNVRMTFLHNKMVVVAVLDHEIYFRVKSLGNRAVYAGAFHREIVILRDLDL
jgi:hypothetical protein